MRRIDELVDEMISIRETYRTVPAEERTIESVESKLGVRLPEDFRYYVRAFGVIGWVGYEEGSINGIWANDPDLASHGTVLGDTEYCRSRWGLPAHYIVVTLDDDFCHCIDSSTGAVVAFDRGVAVSKASSYASFAEFLSSYIEHRRDDDAHE